MSEYVTELKEWILHHRMPKEMTCEEEERKMVLHTDYASASVVFQPNEIVEYCIENKDDGEIVFYLHFQLNDMHHAKELFEEMLQALLDVKNQRKVKILLSCTSALTTSFFASKLTQSAELLGMPYVFDAVSVNHLSKQAAGYRMILLAPQVAYCREDIRKQFPDRPVENIPGKLYGSYDVRGVLKMVERLLMKEEQKETETLAVMPENHARILSITTYIDQRFRIRARIVDHGQTESEFVTIKNRMEISDLEDIVDTVMAEDDDLDAVVMCLPGIIENGVWRLIYEQKRQCDLKQRFQSRYPYRFYFVNNGNATALGLAQGRTDRTVIYYSQQSAGRKGGQGIVVNGKLLTGKGGFAGEVTKMLERIDLDRTWENAETAVDACAKVLLSDICLIGPDEVYVNCRLIPEPEPVVELLQSWMDEAYLPKVKTVPNIAGYTIAGGLLYCLQQMKEEGVAIRR